MEHLIEQPAQADSSTTFDILLTNAQRLASIGALTSSVAQELANLLSVVTAACGSLEAALREEPNNTEAVARYVGQIEQNAFRSAHLVQMLRNYGAVGNSRPAVTDIQAILHDALALVQTLEPVADIRVTMPDDRQSIVCDHGAIVQMLVILLTNAFDAAEPQGGMIELGCQVLPADQAVPLFESEELPPRPYERIAFFVRDQGEGIPTDLQDQIFAPFFSTRSSNDHMGLGLTIAQRIAGQHHGRIVAMNNASPAGGATFLAILPARLELL